MWEIECEGEEEEGDTSEQSANWGAPARLTRAHERPGGSSVIIGIGAADGRGDKAAESKRGGGGLNEWATALSVPAAERRRVTVTSEEVVEREESRREKLGSERETREAVGGGDKGGGSSELRADGGEGGPGRREWRELQREKARRVIRLAELQPVGLPSGSKSGGGQKHIQMVEVAEVSLKPQGYTLSQYHGMSASSLGASPLRADTHGGHTPLRRWPSVRR